MEVKTKEEMECGQFLLKQKLDFFDILKESLSIPYKNTNFIIFTCFTSLPLFLFLVFYELFLQKTMVKTSAFLFYTHDHHHDDDYYYYYYDRWPVYDHFTRTSIQDLYSKLIQLCFLYLIPYHLLELFNMIVITDTASKMYAEEKPVSIKEMMSQPISIIRLKGPFITSMYVLFWSTCALLGLVWVVSNSYILSKSFVYRYSYSNLDFYAVVLIIMFHGLAFLGLLMKYLEWSAGWNMGLVISVLEETYGTDAFDLAAYFSRGSKQRGRLLMLVFFVWGIVLRLPCLFCGCNESLGGIVFTSVYTSLICLGNALKWVVCLVYFFDCKKQILEKKVDEEVGREVKIVNG